MITLAVFPSWCNRKKRFQQDFLHFGSRRLFAKGTSEELVLGRPRDHQRVCKPTHPT